MFYGLHSTKKSERDMVIAQPYELIDIAPDVFHRHPSHKPIVWEEDTGKYYEHTIQEFLSLLEMVSAGISVDSDETAYFMKWKYKGNEIKTRILNLPGLFNDIKENGIKEPVDCEVTGERLDGSYRTKIAMFLGIPTIKAKLHKFCWQDIDEDFIRRKLMTRWMSTGKEYYEFDYGYKDLKNIPVGGSVYQENARDRWEIIKNYIHGKTVLDIGCNEGYMAIQCAMLGKKTIGIDIDYTHGAWLNKLIFEWVKQTDVPVSFAEQRAQDYDKSADTVLMLNMIYHIPDRKEQVALIKKHKGKNMIFQCNYRKNNERGKYFGAHPDDLAELIDEAGASVIEYQEWRDKPIVIAT